MASYVVLLAAGSGRRFGAQTPKQWTMLGGKPVAAWSLASFAAHPQIDAVQLVVPSNDVPTALANLCVDSAKILPPVPGGDSREASTRAGLQALMAHGATDDDIVLVHDAARPLVPIEVVANLITCIKQGAVAAIPVVDIADTLKSAADLRTVDRESLKAAQTPQAFRFGPLLTAHQSEIGGTDDASLMEASGHQVHAVPGDRRLHKLTSPTDKLFLEAILNSQAQKNGPAWVTRTGLGFDVHAFANLDNSALDNGDIAHSKQLILGGVTIPAEVEGARPLAGHSDADAVLHAITDAILGALADGDIGSHFPPSDPQWRGASSDRFLAFAAKERLSLRDASISNIDVTIICERPKIGPFRAAMVQRIAQICEIPPSRVSVKATTTERLGFTGRREGIACQAVATIQGPANAWD